MLTLAAQSPRVVLSRPRVVASGRRPVSVTMAAASRRAVAAAADIPVLHGFPTSSTSFLARIALNAKGVEYREVPLPVTLLANGRPDPEGAKPYLECRGSRIEKPGAIFNHVNEAYDGPSLLPEDTAARARCRTLATLCATEIAPFGYYRAIRLLEDELGVSPEGIRKYRDYWHSHGFGEIERILATEPVNGKFLQGDSITMADIFIMPQVYHSQKEKYGAFPLKDYPRLEKAYMNFLNDPKFQKALPENCK